MVQVEKFRGNFRVSRLASNSPDIPDGTIQIQIDAFGERDVVGEKRMRIVVLMSPAAFASGLVGLADLDDQCEIEIKWEAAALAVLDLYSPKMLAMERAVAAERERCAQLARGFDGFAIPTAHWPAEIAKRITASDLRHIKSAGDI